MAIIRWSPDVDYSGGWSALQRSYLPFVNPTFNMNSLLNPFSMTTLPTPGEQALYMTVPPVDLIDKNNEFIVKADVPGVDPSTLKITVSNNILTIRGERHQEREWKSENYFWTERNAGVFQRSITLPVSVDPSEISAFCDNGILTVHLPKSLESTSVEIGIQGTTTGYGRQTSVRRPGGTSHTSKAGSRKSRNRMT